MLRPLTIILTSDGFIHDLRRPCSALCLADLHRGTAATDSDTLDEAIKGGGVPCPYCC